MDKNDAGQDEVIRYIKDYGGLIYRVCKLIIDDSGAAKQISKKVLANTFHYYQKNEGNPSLLVWLASYAYQTAFNDFRNYKKQLYLELHKKEQKLSQIGERGLGFNINNLDHKVRDAIDLLPVNYKIVLVLNHQEGFDIDGIHKAQA